MKGKVLLLIKRFIRHNENQLLRLLKRVNIELQNVLNTQMIITQDLITAKMVNSQMMNYYRALKKKDSKTKKNPTKMSSLRNTKKTLQNTKNFSLNNLT